MVKQCTCCKRTRGLECFYIDKRNGRPRSWCKDCCIQSIHKWKTTNVQKAIISGREYHAKNREKERRYKKEWKEKNREAARKSYIKDNRRVLSTINGKLSRYAGNATRRYLRGGKDRIHWAEIVGYSTADLRAHLEKQFSDGMTWENYGRFGWHIDHIIPISAFNFKSYDDVDFKRCWSLENLRPMWWSENILKGNRIDKPFQPSLAMPI
jgi:hypothetical protein